MRTPFRLRLSFACILPLSGTLALQSAPQTSQPLAPSSVEALPPLRGFRPAILPADPPSIPFDYPDPSASPHLLAAASIIQSRLAADGLLSACAQVFSALPPSALPSNPPDLLAFFQSAGVPTDLLAFFSASSSSPASAAQTLLAVQSLVLTQQLAPADIASHFTFSFQPSAPGFHVCLEDGSADPTLFRLQLPFARYYQGPGDGGALDLARQLVDRLPHASFLIGVPADHASLLQQTLAPVSQTSGASLAYCSADLVLSQWAQDNGKPGIITPPGAPASIATLIPRYASRGEIGATFVSGESLIFSAVAAAGHHVIHSPLLFQGGNLLAYRNPLTLRRVLLVGEAELLRNTALGLSSDQVLHAFCAEFGVDDCISLPAVSFHIDFELSIRVHDGRLLAFVNDPHAAVRAILACALDPLVKNNLLSHQSALDAAAAIRESDLNSALAIIMPPLTSRSVGPGRIPLDVAQLFALGPADSGVGNLQRILLAADLAAAADLSLDPATLDPDTRTYLRSLQRSAADRAALHEKLSLLGFSLIPIPSLSNGARSLNYINLVPGKSFTLLPAYGGLFAPLDDQVLHLVQNTLGPSVRIIPILTGETQRRHGGLHCALSAAYP